jgi:hypothetical protein
MMPEGLMCLHKGNLSPQGQILVLGFLVHNAEEKEP